MIRKTLVLLSLSFVTNLVQAATNLPYDESAIVVGCNGKHSSGNHNHAAVFSRYTYTIDTREQQGNTDNIHIRQSWFDFEPTILANPVIHIFFEDVAPIKLDRQQQPILGESALPEAIERGALFLSPGGQLIVELMPTIFYDANQNLKDQLSSNPFVGFAPLNPQDMIKRVDQGLLGINGARTASQISAILNNREPLQLFLENLGLENVRLQANTYNPYNGRQNSYFLTAQKPFYL